MKQTQTPGRYIRHVRRSSPETTRAHIGGPVWSGALPRGLGMSAWLDVSTWSCMILVRVVWRESDFRHHMYRGTDTHHRSIQRRQGGAVVRVRSCVIRDDPNAKVWSAAARSGYGNMELHDVIKAVSQQGGVGCCTYRGRTTHPKAPGRCSDTTFVVRDHPRIGLECGCAVSARRRVSLVCGIKLVAEQRWSACSFFVSCGLLSALTSLWTYSICSGGLRCATRSTRLLPLDGV